MDEKPVDIVLELCRDDLAAERVEKLMRDISIYLEMADMLGWPKPNVAQPEWLEQNHTVKV